jgi:DNA-binding CsgD family transcriptional regulator
MISGASQHNLLGAIADTCRAGLDLDELRRRLLPRLRRAVPIDALWWAVADPATLLFNRADREGIPAETGAYFIANEFLDDDVNKWTELARDRRGVRTLWEATDGEPESSARYRDIFKPLGLGDEMRAVLRADGECWGYLCMHRERPSVFSAQELGFVERIAPHLADGFRLSTLIGNTLVEDASPPGLVVLDGNGSRSATNTVGEHWLDELSAGPGRHELPLEVLAVAARLQRLEGTEGRSPRLRVRTRSGRWAILHASWLGEPPSRSVAVVIEEASAAEVLPVLLHAYGFTQQERRVTRLVCHGLSTVAIAARLHVTTNTVQDHLKSIFSKTGVHSRRELVATLLKQQYH